MKIRSRGFQIILLIFAFGLGSWGYKSYNRHRKILDFFKESEDLAWARTYLDNKINFCDAPWQNTVVHKIDGKDHYHSPTGRFTVNIYTNNEHEEAFDLINTNNEKMLLTYTFNWDPKGAGLGYNDFKWTKYERFLVFRKPITMDSDWATSQIYVCDTATGGVIYLGDSEFYECVLRNW